MGMFMKILLSINKKRKRKSKGDSNKADKKKKKLISVDVENSEGTLSSIGKILHVKRKTKPENSMKNNKKRKRNDTNEAKKKKNKLISVDVENSKGTLPSVVDNLQVKGQTKPGNNMKNKKEEQKNMRTKDIEKLHGLNENVNPVYKDQDGTFHVTGHYLSLSHILNVQGAKNLLWDVSEDNNVYRLSQSYSIMIRSYIMKMQKSHQKKKVHQWKDLLLNIGFYKNNYNEIRFFEKPIKVSDDSFLEMRKKDYKNLAELMSFVREKCGLPEFPDEIEDFIILLNDPEGKEFLILNHYALLTSFERVKLVNTVIKKLCIPTFEELIKSDLVFNKRYLAYMKKERLEDRLKKDDFINENVFHKAGLVGSKSKAKKGTKSESNVKVKNSFMQLLQIIRNLTEHAIKVEEIVHSRYDVEWKMFNLFPFYTHLLCFTLIKHGFYPRLSLKGSDDCWAEAY